MCFLFVYFSFGGRDRPGNGSGSRGGGFGGGSSRGGGFGGGSFGAQRKGSQPGERLRKPKWDMTKLPRFEKNFYTEHPAVTNRSPVSLLIMMFISGIYKYNKYRLSTMLLKQNLVLL